MLSMLKIRLKRVGRKHDPSFRIIVTEKHLGPKSGKYIENVGFYNVLKGEKDIQGERVKYWIGKGAQVSDTVHNLLVSEGVIEGKKKNVLPKKTPILKDVPEEAKTEAKEERVETSSAEATEVKAAEEAPTEAVEEEKTDAPAEEAPVEEKAEEKPEEVPTEEKPSEDTKEA